MRRTVMPLMVSVMMLGMAAISQAAGKCAKTNCPGCEACGSKPACGCGVEIQYETRQITCYKTVFEEIKEKKEVPAIKYVPETELRDVVCTVCQPLPPEACGPSAGCGQGASCCQAPKCCPETCIRKVPVTVYRAVPDKKVIETVRIVEKKVPYTITCYVPKPCCTPQPECSSPPGSTY